MEREREREKDEEREREREKERERKMKREREKEREGKREGEKMQILTFCTASDAILYSTRCRTMLSILLLLLYKQEKTSVDRIGKKMKFEVRRLMHNTDEKE